MKEHLELHTFLEQMGFTGLSIDEAVEITLDHGGMDTLALDSRDVLMALGGKSDLDWDMLISCPNRSIRLGRIRGFGRCSRSGL